MLSSGFSIQWNFSLRAYLTNFWEIFKVFLRNCNCKSNSDTNHQELFSFYRYYVYAAIDKVLFSCFISQIPKFSKNSIYFSSLNLLHVFSQFLSEQGFGRIFLLATLLLTYIFCYRQPITINVRRLLIFSPNLTANRIGC